MAISVDLWEEKIIFIKDVLYSYIYKVTNILRWFKNSLTVYVYIYIYAKHMEGQEPIMFLKALIGVLL